MLSMLGSKASSRPEAPTAPHPAESLKSRSGSKGFVARLAKKFGSTQLSWLERPALHLLLSSGLLTLRPPKAPDKVFIHRLRFKAQSGLQITEGDPRQTPHLAVSGLGSSAYPLAEYSHFLHKQTNAFVAKTPLAFHNGDFKDLARSNIESMVQEIVEAAKTLIALTGRRPVLHLFSTANLAGLIAQQREPGLFAGMILISPPFHLRSALYRIALSGLVRAMRVNPNLPLWRRLCGTVDTSELTSGTKLIRRNPTSRHIPATTLAQFELIRREGLKLASSNGCPKLAFFGTKDSLVDHKRSLRAFLGDDPKGRAAIEIEDAPHNMLLTRYARKVKMEVLDFMKRHQTDFDELDRLPLLAEIAGLFEARAKSMHWSSPTNSKRL